MVWNRMFQYMEINFKVNLVLRKCYVQLLPCCAVLVRIHYVYASQLEMGSFVL